MTGSRVGEHSNIRLAIVLTVGGAEDATPAWLRDLTLEGAFVESRARPAAGQQLSIQLASREAGDCVATGRVAHVIAPEHDKNPGLQAMLVQGFVIEFSQINRNFARLVDVLERVPPEFRHDVLSGLVAGEIRVSPAGISTP